MKLMDQQCFLVDLHHRDFKAEIFGFPKSDLSLFTLQKSGR